MTKIIYKLIFAFPFFHFFRCSKFSNFKANISPKVSYINIANDWKDKKVSVNLFLHPRRVSKFCEWPLKTTFLKSGHGSGRQLQGGSPWARWEGSQQPWAWTQVSGVWTVLQELWWQLRLRGLLRLQTHDSHGKDWEDQEDCHQCRAHQEGPQPLGDGDQEDWERECVS